MKGKYVNFKRIMADKIVRDLNNSISEKNENSIAYDRQKRISEDIQQLMVFNRKIR